MGFTDNFTRIDEDPLGGNWTTHPNAPAGWKLVSNAVLPIDLGSDCVSYRNDFAPTTDQYMQVAGFTTSTDGGGRGPGVGCRVATGADTYYRLVADHAASNNVGAGSVSQTTNQTTHPSFKNAATRDYRLAVGSSAIDTGTYQATPSHVLTDFNGVSRDNPPNKGAYEGAF